MIEDEKDLLKLLDLTREDITKILDVADQMKYNQKHGLPHDCLKGKTLAMIFEKNSTRTRVSFEVGVYQMGDMPSFSPARRARSVGVSPLPTRPECSAGIATAS